MSDFRDALALPDTDSTEPTAEEWKLSMKNISQHQYSLDAWIHFVEDGAYILAEERNNKC